MEQRSAFVGARERRCQAEREQGEARSVSLPFRLALTAPGPARKGEHQEGRGGERTRIKEEGRGPRVRREKRHDSRDVLAILLEPATPRHTSIFQ